MARKHINYYNGYYYQGDLTDKQIGQLQWVYNQQSIEKFKNILNGVTLRDFQTLIPAAAYLNKRFICGDSPGLGKTVEAAAYLAYLNEKQEMKKFIFCTTMDALFQIKGEIEFFTGLKVLALWGDARNYRNILRGLDLADYDGIIIPHSSLISNSFNKLMSEHIDKFDVFILDESSCVKTGVSSTYEQAKLISSRMNRVLYLNGTIFETCIMDMYWQYDSLNGMLLPAKTTFQKEFCIFDSRAGHWTSKMGFDQQGNYTLQRQFVRTGFYKPVGYKNQSVFKERVKFHYLGREKKDVYMQLPEHNYSLIPVDTSPAQSAILNTSNYEEVLNSPRTMGITSINFNREDVPKLGKLVEICKDIVGRGESTVVYCWFIEAQRAIQEELKKEGIRAEIISGEVDGSEREHVRQAFQDREYNVLITNISRAINLGTAENLIFYTIPTNPAAAHQVQCRIDRNNDTDRKNYIFMVYYNTQESHNLKTVLCDREYQANAFTGKSSRVFEDLSRQLNNIEQRKIA